ncbi:MmgE/PrpD family protein [Bosea sp. LjRoot9]|uniref:MmgE/PrpD family protein n=1 Tax=Bosea sp. LjRoot9 TaxID=3342341 RepID=UPI003ED171E0
MPTLTQEIARFVASLRAETLPLEVVDKARSCLVNALGMAVNGFDTPYAPVARRAALALDGEVPTGATLFGDGRRSTIGAACLANSALFHGRAQEDSCGAAHFGTILIPMLLAMTEARGYPLARLIPALVAGYEAGGLLETAFAINSTPAGFRSSATYGCVAAAAAAGKLMGLDEERLAAALANAVSFTGGVLQSFADGTDEWRYQVGVIARNGLVAAELAAAGSVSAPHAFEGRAGLIRCYASVEPPADLTARLGKDWSILRVTFKPFPVCAFNQTPVTGALALRRVIAGEALAAVRVRMNPYETGYAGMDAVGPFNSISGTLMSIPFCIATTLVHGVPSMKRMTTYDDAAVNGLVAKITLVTDPEVPVLSAVLEADTVSGARHVHAQTMTPADYAFDRATLRELLTRIGAEQRLRPELFERIERVVDALPDGGVREIVDLFAAIEPHRRAA